MVIQNRSERKTNIIETRNWRNPAPTINKNTYMQPIEKGPIVAHPWIRPQIIDHAPNKCCTPIKMNSKIWPKYDHSREGNNIEREVGKDQHKAPKAREHNSKPKAPRIIETLQQHHGTWRNSENASNPEQTNEKMKKLEKETTTYHKRERWHTKKPATLWRQIESPIHFKKNPSTTKSEASNLWQEKLHSSTSKSKAKQQAEDKEGRDEPKEAGAWMKWPGVRTWSQTQQLSRSWSSHHDISPYPSSSQSPPQPPFTRNNSENSSTTMWNRSKTTTRDEEARSDPEKTQNTQRFEPWRLRIWMWLVEPYP